MQDAGLPQLQIECSCKAAVSRAIMVLGFNFNRFVVSSYHLAPFRAAKMEDFRMVLACLVSPDVPPLLTSITPRMVIHSCVTCIHARAPVRRKCGGAMVIFIELMRLRKL